MPACRHPLDRAACEPFDAFAADLERLAAAGEGLGATLARYIALFSAPGVPALMAAEAPRFFRLNLAWLTAAFERGHAAGEVGDRLVPEASAMVLLARLEAAALAGTAAGPALLEGLTS